LDFFALESDSDSDSDSDADELLLLLGDRCRFRLLFSLLFFAFGFVSDSFVFSRLISSRVNCCKGVSSSLDGELVELTSRTTAFFGLA